MLKLGKTGLPVPKIGFALFAMSALGIKLYDWQMKILLAMELKQVSGVVCNGGGKSSVILSTLVLAFMYNWPHGRCCVTSGSWNQIESMVWPAIERHRSLQYFEGWTFNQCEIVTPQGGFARGVSTDNAMRLEGWHQDLTVDPAAPCMYLVDEAKAISDEKFVAIGKCTPTFYGQFSSAGDAAGSFYNSFSLHKRLFWTTKVSSYECPHITEAQRSRDRELLYPADFAAKHLSEFDQDSSNSVLNRAMFEKNFSIQIKHTPGLLVAFCDFAAGGAENVIAVLDGNKVELVAMWRNPDTTAASWEFIEHFKRLNLSAGCIYGDADGMGTTMISNIKTFSPFHVHEVRNGLPAKDQEHYANIGAEAWFKGAMKIERGEVIVPNDTMFIAQATNRKRARDSKGRLAIESKDDMARRGVLSPDRADAILGVMECASSAWTGQLAQQVRLGRSEFHTAHVNW
jgi:hypothetical protein